MSRALSFFPLPSFNLIELELYTFKLAILKALRRELSPHFQFFLSRHPLLSFGFFSPSFGFKRGKNKKKKKFFFFSLSCVAFPCFSYYINLAKENKAKPFCFFCFKVSF